MTYIPPERTRPRPPRPHQKPGNTSTPRKPDPNITPTTMKGNYPKKDKRLELPEWYDLFQAGIISSDEYFQKRLEGTRAIFKPDYPCYWSSESKSWVKRQPSLTPYTRGMAPFTTPEWLLRFIDWLNGKVGAGHKAKPKQKRTTEQMATLEELFDGVEEAQIGERPVIKPLGPSADTMR